MKKIYLSFILTGLTFSGLYAQQKSDFTINEVGPQMTTITNQKPNKPHQSKAIIWSEDFSNGLAGMGTNGAWTANAIGTSPQIWKHSFFTTSGEWSSGTAPFMSTTASNGFMLFDSDSVNNAVAQGNQSLYAPYAGELVSPVINMTGQNSAMLVFEQDFRYCCAGAGQDLNVQVSQDGGATWSAPIDVTFGTAVNADFFTSNGSSYQSFVNISALAANQANMRFKFTWDGNTTGSSHYYWTIDDVNIETLPDNDLQVQASWIMGQNNEGTEYGRVPEDQQDGNYLIGSQVHNFGANAQTNVIWDGNYTAFTSQNTAFTNIPSGDTVIIENTEALTLTPAVYSGTHTVVSDLEGPSSPEFGNNTGSREFEITPASTAANSIYAQDGIGVYTTNVNISSLGTNSFTTTAPGSEDGLVLAAWYHIKSQAQVSGIRAILANGTVAGGQILGSIKDTATFLAGNMTSLFQAPSYTVTATDITNGYVDLMFQSPITLNAGAYYAATELYSNGNTNDVRIADDESVVQPFWASAIYIPGDQSYTNGEAFAIQLLMGTSWVGLEEAGLTGVSVYPNPSTGVINVTNENGTANTIVVYDMLGQVIATETAGATTTIDLTNNGTGVYLVKVAGETGSYVERVVIK